MIRPPLTLHAQDLSSYARSLSKQMGAAAPRHLTLMNMLARAAGYQNVQHMRAVQAAQRRAQTARPTQEAVQLDHRLLACALAQFDKAARLRQWPARRSVQGLALWALWASLPAAQPLGERALNSMLSKLHCFGDPATLRRTMIANGLLKRSPDCSDYMRIEQQPPAEALALIAALKDRIAS